MSLGFTVEELAGAARAGGALRMGLVRLEEGEWLWPEFDSAARRAAFAARPDGVVVCPGAEAAAVEAAAMVAGCDDLGEAAQKVWEDLCVLEAEDPAEGPYRLTAAAVGFPTDWRLQEKMGQPLMAIHAPIHGYAEQLSRGVDHFFRTLKAGEIYGRSNWFVVANDNLRYLPQGDPAERFAHVTERNAGESLFLRCERQTLRRMPQSGAVLFTIGIAVEPLGKVSTALLDRIAGAVTDLGEGEHARRAAPHYAGALVAYAAARSREQMGRAA